MLPGLGITGGAVNRLPSAQGPDAYNADTGYQGMPLGYALPDWLTLFGRCHHDSLHAGFCGLRTEHGVVAGCTQVEDTTVEQWHKILGQLYPGRQGRKAEGMTHGMPVA